LTGETRIKFTRFARGKIKFLKRKSLQKYRQKAGRFADENFILNLARGAGKFDAKK